MPKQDSFTCDEMGARTNSLTVLCAFLILVQEVCKLTYFEKGNKYSDFIASVIGLFSRSHFEPNGANRKHGVR